MGPGKPGDLSGMPSWSLESGGGERNDGFLTEKKSKRSLSGFLDGKKNMKGLSLTWGERNWSSNLFEELRK